MLWKWLFTAKQTKKSQNFHTITHVLLSKKPNLTYMAHIIWSICAIRYIIWAIWTLFMLFSDPFAFKFQNKFHYKSWVVNWWDDFMRAICLVDIFSVTDLKSWLRWFHRSFKGWKITSLNVVEIPMRKCWRRSKTRIVREFPRLHLTVNNNRKSYNGYPILICD